VTQVPDWYRETLEHLPPRVRRQRLEAVAHYSDEDWRALKALQETYHLSDRTEAEFTALQVREQKILRSLPPVRRHGIDYAALWCLGVRVRAAEELWGSQDDPLSRWSVS